MVSVLMLVNIKSEYYLHILIKGHVVVIMKYLRWVTYSVNILIMVVLWLSLMTLLLPKWLKTIKGSKYNWIL